MKSAFAIVGSLAICFLSVAPGARSQTRSQNSKQTYNDPEGYEVLSVLLNRLSDARKNDTIRIDPRSARGTTVAEIKTQCSGVPDEFRSAWNDLDKKLELRMVWQRNFTLTKPYEVAYATPLPPLGKPESREEAHKRIRSGTYYLAPAGFNENRTRAVAFVEYLCGSLCGDSIFYFLRKSDKGWQEAPEVQRQVQRCGRIY
jgi:hypothetical protein